MIIRDIFLYFARFVPKAVLRDVFQMKNSEEWDELKEECLSLPDDRVIPAITSFIIGPDEESVRKRISSATGMYIFVDYGSATSYIDRFDVKTDKMHIGITCAIPTPEDTDQASLILFQDQTLSVIKTIRDTMRADSYDHPSLEWVPMEASTASPFMAKALAGSTGWMLEWNAKFTDKL